MSNHQKYRTDERGSILPLVGLLMVACVGAMWILGLAAREVNADAKSQIAADAAALAGAQDGRFAALQAARANGGVLVSYVEKSEGDVLVTVRIERYESQARAQSETDDVGKLVELAEQAL